VWVVGCVGGVCEEGSGGMSVVGMCECVMLCVCVRMCVCEDVVRVRACTVCGLVYVHMCVITQNAMTSYCSSFIVVKRCDIIHQYLYQIIINALTTFLIMITA